MTRVQVLEREVKKLAPSKLAVFREWFQRYDSDAWDRQIARNVRAGKIERIAKQAVRAHRAGKTREL